MVMMGAALLLGISARYVWYVGVEGYGSHTRNTLFSYIHSYALGVWILVLISTAVFSFSGLYTRRRAHRPLTKILIVLRGVTLSYLIFGFISLLFEGKLGVPRVAIFIAWGISCLALGMGRVWSGVWKNMLQSDPEFEAVKRSNQRDRVLVIGGAGYIGSALVIELLAKGVKVRVLDLLMYGTDPLKTVLEHPNLELVRADFRQIDKVVAAVRDVDTVVHLGGIVGDPACSLDKDLTIDVNVTATRMIAEVAKGHGVGRFIFASTCSVYGASDEMLDEQSRLNPVSLYAQSKIACERILQKMGDDSFATVILRFATIYGLSGRIRFDLVVNLLTAKAVVDGVITVRGGDQWRPFLHVQDAAHAVRMALEAPIDVVRNRTFNVGSEGQNYTILQVGEMIHRFVPEARLLDEGFDQDRRNYRVSFDRVRTQLGFAPRWNVERGIHQVIDAIRSGNVGNYKDARYSNFEFMSSEVVPSLAKSSNDWVYELLQLGEPVAVGSLDNAYRDLNQGD